jgi:hypothetical protein
MHGESMPVEEGVKLLKAGAVEFHGFLPNKNDSHEATAQYYDMEPFHLFRAQRIALMPNV